MTNALYDALIAPHRGNSATFLACDDGSSISFDAFTKRAAQIANVLAEVGVKTGDCIVVQAPKLADSVALYAASLQVGAVYLPLNTAYTLSELEYFVSDAAPALIVCDPKNYAEIKELLIGQEKAVLTLGGNDGTLTLAANKMPENFATVARSDNDLAALLYTSGTTGRSKGAMLSHNNLLSNAKALVDLWEITSGDRLIHALPIFHTHGLFVALNTALLAGVEVRLMQTFDIDKLLAELPKSTLLMGVPTFYTRLLADARFDQSVTEKMRLFISGSAPLLAETHQEFETRTGHRILERYGMTETNMITSNPYQGDRLAGTVGYPLDGTEVKVSDPDTGAKVPMGDIGMIEVRGDNVFSGYWNMPEKTAEELRPDGFFITGDLGRFSDDGRLTIVGRAKDLIISGGYNIYPKEIEDVLNDIEGVDESAVFGVPHADFGESVVAAIVPIGSQTTEIETLKSVVEAQLARFKHPRRYIVLQELPRNTMGKVQKNVLRDTYRSES